MTELSKKIFNEYQVRKSKKQKDSFISLMKERYPQLKIEESKGIFHTRNLIIGDIDSSELVLTAHYDTCAVLPIPNFITPKNIFIFMLYQLFIMCLIIIVATVIEVLAMFAIGESAGTYVGILSILFMAWWTMFGKANKHTANDNTSGVITLIEIMESMTDEQRKKTAFVFFDLEEAGLIGSNKFKKVHKSAMNDKLLINFDCVSDGDYIMLIKSKYVNKEYDELFRKAFTEKGSKTPLFEKSTNTIYPSDQANFKKSVAVASFKKHKLLGYYMDKIHTDKDRNFDEENITYIKEAIKNFVNIM